MIRSKSSSTIEDTSSIITGDSIQLKLEGQWDESVSIDDINKCIIEHLHEKLTILKIRYNKLKKSNDVNKRAHIEKKIVAARINYQRYVNVTKDILQRCNEFVKVRKDTPGTRIAFIRNVQGYFSQAKDFIKLDISLKKISPTLFAYIQPRITDSPGTFKRKRELCKVMTNIINNDKSCLINSGVGKVFRSRYAQQAKFVHSEYPDSWLQYLPVVLRNSLKTIPEHDKRWAITILYILSKHCTINYLQQGFCPSCLFPIINQRTQGTVGGKLYCPGCKKEIEWTYYMNPRTICIILSGFHKLELNLMIENLKSNIINDPEDFIISGSRDNFFEDILEEYIKNSCEYMDSKRNTDAVKQIITPTKGKCSASEPDEVEEPVSDNESISTDSSSDMEYTFPTLNMVIDKANERLKIIYGDGNVVDNKLARDVYNSYKEDIQIFEGKCKAIIPRGLIPKIDRYIGHYYGLPPKEKVKKFELNAKGDRTGTSRKMIYEALTDMSLTKLHGLVSILNNKMWKAKIPNLSPKHLNIISDCVLQKEVFGRISETHGRKSNINQKIILMYILRRYGYPWDGEDFNIPYNQTTLSKYQELLDSTFNIIYPPKA